MAGPVNPRSYIVARILREDRGFSSVCWTWKLTKRDIGGYGSSSINGVVRQAHVASYVAFKGEIPSGLVLDHLCRNRDCVSPSHLEPVTQKQNVMRGLGIASANAKKTHCLKGHPLFGDNLYVPPNRPNRRQCRICVAERHTKRTERIKKNA